MEPHQELRQTHVDDLPDVVMLNVLSFLRPVNLRAAAFLLRDVGAVCRRWRALSRERCVWRGADIKYTAQNAEKQRDLALVLAAAPRVKTLLLFMMPDEPVSLRKAMARSTCTVERLLLYVDHVALALLPLCLDMISARAGSLKVLKLWTGTRGAPVGLEGLSLRFWGCVDQMQTLELTLDGTFTSITCSSYEFAPRTRQTLKTLHISRGRMYESDPGVSGLAVTSLIRAHKDTLETVRMTDCEGPDSVPQEQAKLARAIAECRNLKEVSLPGVAEVRDLQNCPKLRCVSILGNMSAVAEAGVQFSEVTDLAAALLVGDEPASLSSIGNVFPNLTSLSFDGLRDTSVLAEVAENLPLLQKLSFLETTFASFHKYNEGCPLVVFDELLLKIPGVHINIGDDSEDCGWWRPCHAIHPHYPDEPNVILSFLKHPLHAPCSVCGDIEEYYKSFFHHRSPRYVYRVPIF